MSVYILHFDRPVGHAQHYTGFSTQIIRRIRHHRCGTGARLTQVARERGIGFKIGKLWRGPQYGRSFERKIKTIAHPKRFCSICRMRAKSAHLEIDEQ